MTAPLYHFTCAHAERGLRGAGILQPHRQPTLGGVSLIWLTDLEVPDREGLGLTSDYLRCDRTEVRYIVKSPADCHWWPEWASTHWVDPTARSVLEFGRKPRHWWVTTEPQVAVRA